MRGIIETHVTASPDLPLQQNWELEVTGRPTKRIVTPCRHSDLITRVPKAEKQWQSAKQARCPTAADDLSTDERRYRGEDAKGAPTRQGPLGAGRRRHGNPGCRASPERAGRRSRSA